VTPEGRAWNKRYCSPEHKLLYWQEIQRRVRAEAHKERG
jgi:hypothetical protein